MNLKKVKRVVSGILGELPLKEKGGTFRPSGFKRETQNAEVAENTGYTEVPVPAELKVKLNSTIDPQSVASLSDDTLTIILSDGDQHVMPNAWCMDTPELGDGEYEVTFNSAKSQKL